MVVGFCSPPVFDHLPSSASGGAFKLSHLDVTRGECPLRARGNYLFNTVLYTFFIFSKKMG